MTTTSNPFQNQISSHIDFINLAKTEFEKACEGHKNIAEQKIAALDKNKADYQSSETAIKVDLKKALNQELENFEKKLKNTFGENLISLEKIYHEKEVLRLEQIEKYLTELT